MTVLEVLEMILFFAVLVGGFVATGVIFDKARARVDERVGRLRLRYRRTPARLPAGPAVYIVLVVLVLGAMAILVLTDEFSFVVSLIVAAAWGAVGVGLYRGIRWFCTDGAIVVEASRFCWRDEDGAEREIEFDKSFDVIRRRRLFEVTDPEPRMMPRYHEIELVDLRQGERNVVFGHVVAAHPEDSKPDDVPMWDDESAQSVAILGDRGHLVAQRIEQAEKKNK